jgi:hypothetical protein
MNGSNRFGIITRSVEFRHAHAAEAHGRNQGSCVS